MIWPGHYRVEFVWFSTQAEILENKRVRRRKHTPSIDDMDENRMYKTEKMKKRLKKQ